jgi:hypothetical protein
MTCGMPLEGEHEREFGMETAEGSVCIHDMKDGMMKSPDEIFEGGVEFFLQSVAEGDRDLAERLVRKNMKSLAYWQSHPFAKLDGMEATDEEFAEVMARL